MAFTVLLLLFSSFLLLPISVFAQTNGKVAVGSSLTATAEGNSSAWLSPSGDFAFGFRQLENNDTFLLSIWYAKIPERTIVWHANEDRPAPKGSLVTLTSNSGLMLTSTQGEVLWNSNKTIVDGDVAYAVMNDTGNFVLQGDNSEDIWDTFTNPTDTMFPGQIIEKGGKLSSRQPRTNYAKGRFQLCLLQDGNLVLNTINLPTENPNQHYYQSSTTGELSSSSGGVQLVLNGSGYMYVLRENGGKFNLTGVEAVLTRDYYIRATLNFDGIFAQYSHPKNSTGNVSWNLLWSEPENICINIYEFTGLGACGYNSLCTLKADKRPTCECPIGYSLLDPNDPYGSCKPDFIQGCGEDELSSTNHLYDVEVLNSTDWPTSDYVELKPFTEEECKESCIQDCMCAVAVSRDDTCWKKKLPLSNGRVTNTFYANAFIKVRKDNLTVQFPPLRPNDRKKKKLLGSVLFGTSVFVNFLLSAAVCLGFFFVFRFRKKHVSDVKNMQAHTIAQVI